MYEDILQSIGLTHGETKVYTTLLKIGETTTGKIIDESGLSSGKIYEILNRLLKKGLITYIVKNKTKYFNACSPNKILEYLDNREKELQQKRDEIERILPSLSAIGKKSEYSAVIYKGIEGLKTAISESLQQMSKQDEWLAFGISSNRLDAINRVWTKFDDKKYKKGVSSKLIFNDRQSYIDRRSKYKQENRILKMSNPAAPVGIAGNAVMIYNWKEVSVIKIINKDIAESFREFFFNLWEIAEKPKG